LTGKGKDFPSSRSCKRHDLVLASSPKVNDIRFVRAWLRANPELLRAYFARKQEIIAGDVADSVEHSHFKGELLLCVWREGT
jgi:GrpB-like predicted nucleotidyltransferase (UPF0157 family)